MLRRSHSQRIEGLAYTPPSALIEGLMKRPDFQASPNWEGQMKTSFLQSLSGMKGMAGMSNLKCKGVKRVGADAKAHTHQAAENWLHVTE